MNKFPYDNYTYQLRLCFDLEDKNWLYGLSDTAFSNFKNALDSVYGFNPYSEKQYTILELYFWLDQCIIIFGDEWFIGHPNRIVVEMYKQRKGAEIQMNNSE